MLLKAAFPTIEVMYTEDWQDFADMHIPYVLERVVVADRGAAKRNSADWDTPWSPSAPSAHEGELRRRQAEDGLPAWAAPFGFDMPAEWWAPARAALREYLGLPAEQARKGKPVVTFVSMREEPYEAGAHLRTEDHPGLVEGLRKLEKEGVIAEFNTVRGNGTRENWEERMKVILRTDVSIFSAGYAWVLTGLYRLCWARSDTTSRTACSCLVRRRRHPHRIPRHCSWNSTPRELFSRTASTQCAPLGCDIWLGGRNSEPSLFNRIYATGSQLCHVGNFRARRSQQSWICGKAKVPG
jgi:hypothetical protein